MVRTITRRPANKVVPGQPETPPKLRQSRWLEPSRSPGAFENAEDSATNKACENLKNIDATENAYAENQIKENNEENHERQTTWEDASEGEGEGKGKSKTTNKTDLENSSLLNENEQQTNSHISETVQVTAQSPSNDNPVDNENGKTVAYDASNCVHSLNDKTGKPNDEDATSRDDVGKDDGNRTDISQSGDVVESEQNDTDNTKQHCDESNTATLSDSFVNSANSDVKTNRSISVDSPPVKDSKKIRLRRNTIQGADTVKTMQLSSTSQENGTETDSRASESEKVEKKAKKVGVKVKLNRNSYKANTSTEHPSNETATEGESVTGTNDTTDQQQNPPKHKQWCGVYQSRTSLTRIDYESLKEVCTRMRILDEKDVRLDLPKERTRATSETEKKIERKISLEFNSEDSDRPEYKKQVSSNSSSDEAKEDNKNIIAFNRKISIVDDTASKLRPPPEPAKNPVSDVLYITNLVRPFTLKQLKGLLERTGKIVDGGFWTDRIKSKCYVHYKTREEAEVTRNALHGVNWPIGNGKKLMIEFGSIEEMQKAQNPPSTTPPRPEVPKEKLMSEKENKDPVKQRRPSEDGPKDATRDATKRRDGRVREWDIGKEDLHRKRSRSRSRNKDRRSKSRERTRSKDQERSKDQDRSRERNHSREKERIHKHRRTPSPVGAYVHKKLKKTDDEVPQKLMDDLFLKTKATPSIYWQPLSPEEIATKQQQRLMRMEEHKRRMEVSSRSRGGRESGRGVPYRRR